MHVAVRLWRHLELGLQHQALEARTSAQILAAHPQERHITQQVLI
jgi:hypothetical protein